MGLALFVFLVLLLAFSLTARRLERAWIGAPIAFTAAGWLVSVVDLPRGGLSASTIHHLAEAALLLVLFHDASKVRLAELRSEAGLVARLLFIGLPLAIAAGYGLGLALFPGLGVGLTLFLAAALAPTDAGLGAPTVSNPAVPLRVRSVLNVESGLNDGLATPVVIAGLAIAAGHGAGFGGVLVEIALGIAIGTLAGAGGGRALLWVDRHGWTSGTWGAIATAVLPFLAYLGATLTGGNGFIAAFVAGLGYAAMAGRVPHAEERDVVIEATSSVLAAAVWFVFGATIGPVFDGMSGWQPLAFALMALTVLRMAPVAISLIGSRVRWQTAAFIGWFGPRGLASLIFALLSLEELGGETGTIFAEHEQALAAIGLTVLISVVAHGLSGEPLATRYGAWWSRERPPVESS